MKNIGQAIRVGLARKNMKQKDLAFKLGVSTAAVSKWVSGEKNPATETLFKIIELLDIPLESIYKSEKSAYASQAEIDVIHLAIAKLQEKILVANLTNNKT